MTTVSDIEAHLDRPAAQIRALVKLVVGPNRTGIGTLRKAEPQGPNPDILVLRLSLERPRRVNPQALSMGHRVEFTEEPAARSYASATILFEDETFSENFTTIE